MSHRQLVRTVVPPVLALGLAFALVHPLGAVAATTSPVLPVTGGSVAAAAAAARPAGSISVTVPPVSFADIVRVHDGRVRTSVLVAVARSVATASVVGARDCSVPAVSGVVTLLDCAYDGASPVTVAVTLSTGARFTHTAVATVG